MDWQAKYHYREAKGKRCCETCDAFKDGTCEMFDTKVDLKMLCDEWTANYNPKEASFEAFVEGIFAPVTPHLSFEQYGAMVHQGSWDDIVQKALRLIQSGQVTILRNAPHHLMGHVIGDHGEYNTEISRTDPSSNVIEQWQCDCPWDQFAFNRTREWKRFEGRVCFVPGMMVTMADGSHKPIEQVEVGDRVLTHDGIGTVKRTMMNPFKGDLVEIHRTGHPDPIRLTPEHEVLSVLIPDKVRNASYNRKPGSNQGFKIPNAAKILSAEPDWIDAGDLQVHDWVSSAWLPPGREGSVALGTVLGFYLAEGSLAKRTKSDVWGEVQWTFGRDEQYLVDHLQLALTDLGYGVARTYLPRHNAINVRLTSRELAEQLEYLGGHLARTKRLAPEVFRWSPEVLLAMVEAYALGDGTLTGSDRRTCIYTASNVMARQLCEVLLTCGITPSWQRSINNMGPANRDVPTSMNRVLFVPQARQLNGRRRYENHYISKIRRIERVPYDGPVYNLSVDSQESYVVEGVCVHNCSHVLATYWKGKSTTLDYQPDTGPKPFQKQGPPVNRIPTEGPSPGPPENAQQQQDRLNDLREQVKLRQKNDINYLPEEGENLQLPGFRPTQRGEEPPAIPTNDQLIKGEQPDIPFRLPGQPEYQRQELQLFDLSAPPWNPTPVPPQLPTSVPYGDKPDPSDPISGIGFSSIPFGTRRIFDSWWGREAMGLNGPTPSLQFGWEEDANAGMSFGQEEWTITAYVEPHDPAGEITFFTDPRKGADWARVKWLEVKPQYQRLGIASALFDEAASRYAGIEHDTDFTDEGRDFHNGYEGFYPPGDWRYEARVAAADEDFALWFKTPSARAGPPMRRW
jgi:GNAT superfamily N-acetyltransferase